MKKVVTNPYLPNFEYVPDGEPHVFNGRVYVYGSHDRFGSSGFCLNNYITWSAPIDDLSDWRYEGVISYTEYRKDSFDKIHDWERSEFEDLIWTKYQNRIIKLAYLLPYLKKYDGMSRLQVDLASPSTPDGHKSIIADALDQAARYPA